MTASDSREADAPLELRKTEAVIQHDLDQRKPVPVELLASDDQRRLSAATSNVIKPLPGSHAEELAHDLRRITRPVDHDDDDDLAADPFNGDPPNRRSDKEISKLLDLLDSLNTQEERGNH